MLNPVATGGAEPCSGEGFGARRMQSALGMRAITCNLCGADRAKLICKEEGYNICRCRNCSLVYVNPQPSMDASQYWPGDHVTGEHRREDVKRPIFENGLSTLGQLKPDRGRLLDIGCGFGLFVSLAQDQGWEAHGVDLSDVAVSYAREVRGVASVRRCSLEDAGFSRGSFEAVTMWNVLEHVSDPLATLRQVHGLLAEDGLLLVRVPNMSFHHAVRTCGPLLPLAGIRRKPPYLGGISPPKHLFGFNPRTLRGLLERAGYRPLTIGPAVHYRKKSNRSVSILEAVGRTVYVSSFKRSVVSPTMLAYAQRA